MELPSVLSNTPGGTQNWIPHCPEEYKPYVNQSFENLEAAIAFYYKYAEMCGFTVRSGTSVQSEDKIVRLKYLLCNKQGFKKPKKHVDTLGEEKKVERKETRCGCKAMIGFKLLNGVFRVYSFEEKHNHSLVSRVGQQFMKSHRRLNLAQQNFIMECGSVNIGSTTTFRIIKEMNGGYSNVGATQNDCKNFRRDLKLYIGDKDAQMAVNNLERKKECSEGFSFDYYVDDNGVLRRLFWADETSVSDAKIYGDVVSFDATYSSNK